jgi:hypothetical protein
MAMERHYTVGELSKLWFFSENTIRRMFIHEPGVIKITRVKRGYNFPSDSGTKRREGSPPPANPGLNHTDLTEFWDRRMLRTHCNDDARRICTPERTDIPSSRGA